MIRSTSVPLISCRDTTVAARNNFVTNIRLHHDSLTQQLHEARVQCSQLLRERDTATQEALAQSQAQMLKTFQENATLRQMDTRIREEMEKTRNELTKSKAELERTRQAALNHAQQMKTASESQAQKAEQAAQEAFDRRITQVQAEYKASIIKLRATHAEEVRRARATEGSAEVERLQTMLAQRTGRMNAIDQEKKNEVEMLRADQQKAISEATKNAENRFLSRLQTLERSEAKHKEQLEARDCELAERILTLHQEKDALKAIIEASESSASSAEKHEQERFQLSNELLRVKELVASKQSAAKARDEAITTAIEESEQSAASALTECEQRFQRQFDHLSQQLAEADKAAVKLRSDLRDEQSAKMQMAAEGDSVRTTLQGSIDEERSKVSKLEKQLEAQKAKIGSLQEQVEEAETARTMSPGAEQEQQRIDLAENLRQREEQLRLMGEQLERGSEDRLERQLVQSKLEDGIRALEKKTGDLQQVSKTGYKTLASSLTGSRGLGPLTRARSKKLSRHQSMFLPRSLRTR